MYHVLKEKKEHKYKVTWYCLRAKHVHIQTPINMYDNLWAKNEIATSKKDT